MRHYRAECRPVQCAGGRPVETVSVLIVLLVSYPSGRGGPRCWCLLTARPTRGVRGTKLGDWLLTSPCILAEWIERDVRAKLSRKQGNPRVEGVGYAGQRMGRSKRRRQGQEVKDPATQGDVNNSPQGSSRELCIACDWRVSLVAEWVNKQAKPRQDPSRPSTAAVTLFWRAPPSGSQRGVKVAFLSPAVCTCSRAVCVQNVWGWTSKLICQLPANWQGLYLLVFSPVNYPYQEQNITLHCSSAMTLSCHGTSKRDQ
jgi:hypothetical protein